MSREVSATGVRHTTSSDDWGVLRPEDHDLRLPCLELHEDLWFSDTPDEIEAAKAMCRGCPARDGCLAGARERREPCGVWGGELFVKGVVVPRKRPRGRPPKHRAA